MISFGVLELSRFNVSNALFIMPKQANGCISTDGLVKIKPLKQRYDVYQSDHVISKNVFG